MGTIRNHKVLLYGGEPTIDPDFLDIVKNLNDYVRVFTNLSQDSTFLQELIKIRNDMTISISYHIEKTSVNEMIEKLTILTESQVNKIRLKIMADSRIKEKSIELYNLFSSFKKYKNFELYIDLVMANSQGSIGAEWTDEDLEWFLPLQEYKTIRLKYKENGEIKTKDVSWNEMRVSMLDSNNYYRCGAAGKNVLYINSNGDVLPCKSHLDPMFNLVDNNFRNHLNEIKNNGMVCSHMGFCCEVDFPKVKVCKRVVGEQTKNIRNKLL